MKFNLPVMYEELPWKDRRLVRNQYISEQQGLCYWCESPLNDTPPKEIMDKKIDMSLFPKGMLDNPIHLQHDHGTGLTEGAVHARCNCVMWQYHNR